LLDRRVIAYAHRGGRGRAVVHDSRDRGALANGATRSTRRPRDQGPPPRRSHDETVDVTTDARARSPSSPLTRSSPSTTPTGGRQGRVSPGPKTTRTRSGAGPPDDASLGIAPLSSVLELLAGVVGQTSTSSGRPEVEPYEALLADELRRLGRATTRSWRASRTAASRHSERSAPEFSTSLATLETAEFYRAVQPGPRCLAPRVALQCRRASGRSTVVDAQFVEARTTRLACTSGRSTTSTRCGDSWTSCRRIISDTPTALVGVLAASGCAWGGLGR